MMVKILMKMLIVSIYIPIDLQEGTNVCILIHQGVTIQMNAIKQYFPVHGTSYNAVQGGSNF